MTYPKASHTDATGVPASPRFPEIEEGVLAYWEADGTFRASVEQRPEVDDAGARNEFVFYDGPPFANGLPHYGHLLTGYVKDLIPRYRTMRGQRVERRFGWDTHGLPAELEAMRINGIKTTDEIHELGIEKFNDACRDSVLKYTGEWREYVTRQARWVDFDHDYKTMNPEFMESVMWAFKQLHEKGLVYEGFRVLPYCWQDETPLSNHELRMDDDVYQMRQDPAVTVGYTVTTDGPLRGVKVLVWTTTPWTLPSNLAVMVGEDIEYVVVEAPVPGTDETARYLLAEPRLSAYARELADADGEFTVVGRHRGADLVGLEYAPPFSYYAGHQRAFRLVPAEFVTTTDGTGLVHTAGAFGEDDKVVTDREGIEAVMPVGKDGRFTFPVTDYEGMVVFDANLQIIDHLKAATQALGMETGPHPSSTNAGAGSVTPGTVLLRHETYDHSYPHCWRCRQPLIYKGVSSWFVEVTRVKERLMELNQEIRWVPDHIKEGQFGKWLENARDWSITRNRFWGSPVPVWKSDDPAHPRLDVYGSFEEIERDFGRLPLDRDGRPDLHRPFVDELTRPNPDDPTGRSTMRRVADVLDVWFDSGSMSFAQVHYPFDNKDWFDHHFPGDFIVEYIGQTRGWFYTMHVLAGAIFDRPAFSTCVSHGIVLGHDGQKMSKSLRNYPDVREVFDRDGADAMRWFLMSSPILRGGNLVVTEQGIRDSVRQVLLPMWSSWSFFALYANAAGHDARRRTDSAHRMDRYLLAKTGRWVAEMTDHLDNYEVAAACDATRSFLDGLTNWYIRRSRERFWAEEADAFDASVSAYQQPYLDLAGIAPTDRIWDIGCGNGLTTRDAARRAPRGHVAGVDLSEAMLAVARRAAAAEGLTNVTFLHADAQVYPFERGWADLVISRTGSMFFGDPVAAFANIRTGLRPGGRLALLVWQGLARNEWMREIIGALAPPGASGPPPGAPGPFSLSDPARVAEILVPAGFSAPALTPLEAPMTFGSGIDEAFRFIIGLAGWMTRDRPPEDEAAAHAALRASLAAHVRADGVVAYGSATWVISAEAV